MPREALRDERKLLAAPTAATTPAHALRCVCPREHRRMPRHNHHLRHHTRMPACDKPHRQRAHLTTSIVSVKSTGGVPWKTTVARFLQNAKALCGRLRVHQHVTQAVREQCRAVRRRVTPYQHAPLCATLATWCVSALGVSARVQRVTRSMAW